MRDLNDIVESNTKATLDAIPAEQARGKWVLARYTGVNFMGYTVHPTFGEAEDASDEHVKTPGFSTIIHPPVRPRAIHASPQ